jgi:hypothetical protein
MASWILVPCLVALRNEFNALAPDRDRASDGSIGDPAHAASSSNHNPDETGRTPTEDADRRNEVHALDVDKDLRRPGWTMERALEIIIVRHREGRDDRLQNVIYNRRIWSRSWGWTARAYTGANAHTQHAHFSSRYTTAEENDTRPWGLLEDDVTKSEFLSWMTEWARSSAGRAAIATALLTYDPGRGPDGRPAFPGIPDPWTPGDTVSPSTAIATILSTVRDNRRALDQERAEVPPSAAEIAEAVVARLAGTGTAAEKAATLRAVLGPDAAEVGRILAAGLPAA